MKKRKWTKEEEAVLVTNWIVWLQSFGPTTSSVLH
jgi:hypothetical protein